VIWNIWLVRGTAHQHLTYTSRLDYHGRKPRAAIGGLRMAESHHSPRRIAQSIRRCRRVRHEGSRGHIFERRAQPLPIRVLAIAPRRSSVTSWTIFFSSAGTYYSG
jgi:hypothetical protein